MSTVESSSVPLPLLLGKKVKSVVPVAPVKPKNRVTTIKHTKKAVR